MLCRHYVSVPHMRKDEKETTIAGVVYEIAYAGGRPVSVKVHADSGMKELDYKSLLVLQRNSEKT